MEAGTHHVKMNYILSVLESLKFQSGVLGETMKMIISTGFIFVPRGFSSQSTAGPLSNPIEDDAHSINSHPWFKSKKNKTLTNHFQTLLD